MSSDPTYVELIELLTRQRLQLERMLYRATVLRSLIVGGQSRFIAWASDDLDVAVTAVANADLRRAALYEALAATHGLDPNFSFDALAALGGPAYAHLVGDLRSSMGSLAAQVRHTIAAVRDAATDGHAAADDVLARLRGIDPTLVHSPSTPEGGLHVDTRL